MRILITLLSFFFLTHTAQGQAAPPAKPAENIYADFDFKFYPDPAYARYARFLVQDSLTKAESVKRDSTTAQIRVEIEKSGDHLVIRNLQNLTEVIYDAHIRFAGVSSDGSFNQVYKASTQDGETIVINPIRGYAAILYRKCKAKDECDGVYHFFGKGAPNLRP